MKKGSRWYPLIALFLLVFATLFAASRDTVAAPPDGQIVPGQYIILTAEGVDPAAVATGYGVPAQHVYRTAVRGFAGAVPSHALTTLAADPRVILVEPVRMYELADHGGQHIPTGVDRIETDKVIALGTGTAINLDVAIIDTGISSHPDLNLAGGRNFAGGNASNYADRNGHGTHVAGTVGAIANETGVVGVAPGVRLWAVRVCNNLCSSSDIIAGIDWVAEQKSTGAVKFAAANFSISSADSSNPCTSPANATHVAICKLVGTGVVFVMAAGNDGRQKNPYPVAFSVSALADFDGKAGGKGSPTCRTDEDDTLANFSNYGPNVDIAAPGVCILSTWNDGGYNTISGTSMAAPHVTGAVALYISQNGGNPATDADGAATIKNAIIDAALSQGTHECSYNDSRIGGPLLFVNASEFGGNGTCEVAGEGNGGDNGGDTGGSITLSATGYKEKGLQKADLSWAGTNAGVENVDIYRNGDKTTVPNNGAYTDNIDNKGSGSYIYKVCEAGIETCSNEVTVSF
jgi:subtilisin